VAVAAIGFLSCLSCRPTLAGNACEALTKTSLFSANPVKLSQTCRRRRTPHQQPPKQRPLHATKERRMEVFFYLVSQIKKYFRSLRLTLPLIDQWALKCITFFERPAIGYGRQSPVSGLFTPTHKKRKLAHPTSLCLQPKHPTLK